MKKIQKKDNDNFFKTDVKENKFSKKDQDKLAKSHKIVTEDTNVIRATEVRQNFQEIIDRVHYTKDALIISKHKKPWVIISPLSEE